MLGAEVFQMVPSGKRKWATDEPPSMTLVTPTTRKDLAHLGFASSGFLMGGKPYLARSLSQISISSPRYSGR